jgi:hypothetical protein
LGRPSTSETNNNVERVRSLVRSDQKWVKFEPVWRLSNFNTRFGHEKTPHITQQFPSMNFWQTKAFLWFLSPSAQPDLSPCDFFLFSQLKNHQFWYFG